MVYKLGNISDMAMLPSVDDNTYRNIYEFVSVLEHEYGCDRNIDTDDGGYVLYATPGTTAEEIKVYFDYSANTIEWVNTSGDILCALYLLNNDYSVTIIMSRSDAPDEITKAIVEGY